MLGMFWKIQEICTKMGTRILKIDGEMPEINECKVGNPQIWISRNWANLSQPLILTFFEDEIFKPFFQFHVPEVLEWKIAHSLWYKKAQNTDKSPKNDCVTSLRNLQDVSEHPV